MDGKVHGMTANAFMSVSLDPELVVISIKEDAKMLEMIKESGRFSVNILSEKQKKESMTFAGQIDNEEEIVFDELAGNPVLPGSLVQVSCEVSGEYVEGDHTLFIGGVKDICLEDGEPLIFSCGKYRRLNEGELQESG
ncbi:flavin reductase family protein [Virgibacillus sediminis]|uniref:Flavin reductase family protein n=1 Tax=Virgibacillus sediminis TaxID=202260 RepID=A0ABV7A8N7_9BACI